MPILVMTDGRRMDVPYDKAAKIKQILDATVEPDDEAQTQFVLGVQDIIFEKRAVLPIFGQITKEIEHDTVVDDILTDNGLSGYDKFKAIGQRLKERPKHR